MQKMTTWFERARRVLPGGVNSPVRAFGSVGGTPPFLTDGSGARVRDMEGKEYTDYVAAWGPLILGHAPAPVVERVTETLRRGLQFGAPHPLEVELAETIVRLVPSVEQVRMVTSGTEAVMSAVRLARAATKRDRLVKFAGGYHGHSDALLAKAGSGMATLGLPSSPGVPEAVTAATSVLPYNDTDAFRKYMKAHGGETALVLIEPVAGNMGVVPAEPEFLKTVREETKRCGTLLLFDEVISGFRIGLGGAQETYGVLPDLTTLGKIIGGGLPVGAYAGPRELMKQVAPEGAVYQAGTLSGNPLAMAAGLATLEILERDNPYPTLEKQAGRLADGLAAALKQKELPACIQRIGSMLTLFFTDGPVRSYDDASRCDTKRHARFFHGMLERGIYLPPSQFEAWFVSTAHTDDDIDRTIAAAQETLKTLD